MFGFFQDIRFAVRDLRKGFFVTSLAVLSLALAIAGNTTVFGFVNALLFRPLPYPEPDRIVLLGEREENAPPTLVASAANLVDWRERNRSFVDLAGFRPAPMSLGASERPEPIVAAQVSPGFFRDPRSRAFSRPYLQRPGRSRRRRPCRYPQSPLLAGSLRSWKRPDW